MHMGDPDENLIRDRIEGPEKKITYKNGKKAILNKIIQAEVFENITANRWD